MKALVLLVILIGCGSFSEKKEKMRRFGCPLLESKYNLPICAEDDRMCYQIGDIEYFCTDEGWKEVRGGSGRY